MRSGTRCMLEKCLQDRCSLSDLQLFQNNLLNYSMPKPCLSHGSSHIPYPVRVLSQHGHEISLPIHHSHRQRKTDHLPRLSSHDFQSNEIVWEYSQGMNDGPAFVDDFR